MGFDCFYAEQMFQLDRGECPHERVLLVLLAQHQMIIRQHQTTGYGRRTHLIVRVVLKQSPASAQPELNK